MNIVDENKYNEIKNILLGCKNLDDAKYFMDFYIKKNPESKKLTTSIMYGKIYNDECLSHSDFLEIMNKMNNCMYQEQCAKLINELKLPKNNNDIQFKTLIRIMNNKKKAEKVCEEFTNVNNFSYNKGTLMFPSYNPNSITNPSKICKKYKHNEIQKECPHCGEIYNGAPTTTHVICGYSDNRNGYNWSGCQRDWCFSCEKKLCKSWHDNKLWLEPNKIHNSDCCKQSCSKNTENYNNYCQCNNKYVNRKQK
jgi:hypothetical protein